MYKGKDAAKIDKCQSQKNIFTTGRQYYAHVIYRNYYYYYYYHHHHHHHLLYAGYLYLYS